MGIARIVEAVELVSIDSMQVYRGMDIGTATPTPADRRAVDHHMIDLVEPSEAFTAGEFQRRAREVLVDLAHRGRVPVLVGGTGLYLRAVIDDLEMPGRYPDVRGALEADPDTAALHRRLSVLDPTAASRMEPTNRRRIIRALEVTTGSGRPFSSFGPGLEIYPPNRFVQVAIHRPRAEANARIAERYHRQISDGFVDEVARLSAGGLGPTACHALGYKELLSHLAGDCSLDEAIDRAIQRTCRFARRQERWFRRDPRVNWVESPVEPEAVVSIWDEVRVTRT